MQSATFSPITGPQQRISVSTSQGTYVFHTDEITRLQANSNYTFIHFINRKPILISKVLKSYEELLSPMGFIRTHQSHLVNTQYIRFLDRQGNLEMQDASKIEVSRSKRRAVREVIKKVTQPTAAHDQHTTVPLAR